MTMRYRVERCSGISILRVFRTRIECASASCRVDRRMECEASGSVERGREIQWEGATGQYMTALR